jgi:hypothetical protein
MLFYLLHFQIDLLYRPVKTHLHLCGGIIIAKKIAEKETRNFALRDKEGNEIGVFSGKSPRQAALKAANRGHTGTKKVHLFQGERVQVPKPKGAPDWMPDKIWKPKVKKVGIEKIEDI